MERYCRTRLSGQRALVAVLCAFAFLYGGNVLVLYEPPYTIEEFKPESVTCGTVFSEDPDVVIQSKMVGIGQNNSNISRIRDPAAIFRRRSRSKRGRFNRSRFQKAWSGELDGQVRQRYWEEPSIEMKRFMAKWRVAMAPTAKEFQEQRYLTDNATWRVHKLDPLRNKVPDCSKVRGRGPGGRFTLVAVGDSHVRDFGEQMCLQAEGNRSHCAWLGTKRESINDFLYGNVQTHFRWHTPRHTLDIDSLGNASSADMVMYSANAWYTAMSVQWSWQALRRFTSDMLRQLHERFPCAMFVVVPDWYRHFTPWKEGLFKKVPSARKAAYLEHRYRCVYQPSRQQLARRAFLCGVLDFQRNRTNLVPTCPHASRIPMYDEVAVLDYLNFSYHVPLGDLDDPGGHHWYGHYGEAMTMNMIREVLCPVKGHSLTRSMKCYADTLGCDSLSHTPEERCSFVH